MPGKWPAGVPHFDSDSTLKRKIFSASERRGECKPPTQNQIVRFHSFLTRLLRIPRYRNENEPLCFSIPAPRIAARVTARTERERSVGRPEHALVVFRNGRGYTHHTRHHRRATKLRTALAVRCYSLILV